MTPPKLAVTLPVRAMRCPFCGDQMEIAPFAILEPAVRQWQWWCDEDHVCPGHDEVGVAERIVADHADEWFGERERTHGPLVDPL